MGPGRPVTMNVAHENPHSFIPRLFMLAVELLFCNATRLRDFMVFLVTLYPSARLNSLGKLFSREQSEGIISGIDVGG